MIVCPVTYFGAGGSLSQPETPQNKMGNKPNSTITICFMASV
jgi:hypothetical protein